MRQSGVRVHQPAADDARRRRGEVDLDLAALRADIGQFLSPTDLFEGSIEDNVRLGRRLTATQVADALELAGAMHWVATLPRGMRTMLGGGGAMLPTHLAQRLLFAQAIAGEPRMIVLDDFFQVLERETREEFLAVLMDRDRPWTVIAVALFTVFKYASGPTRQAEVPSTP